VLASNTTSKALLLSCCCHFSTVTYYLNIEASNLRVLPLNQQISQTNAFFDLTLASQSNVLEKKVATPPFSE